METPTLRTLVLDLLAESGVVIIEPTTTITSGDIRRAVAQTQRNIPKSGILDNFDKILERELECGNFARVDTDTFRLPPDGMPYELPMPKVCVPCLKCIDFSQGFSPWHLCTYAISNSSEFC